jgi:hypothetical protein
MAKIHEEPVLPGVLGSGSGLDPGEVGAPEPQLGEGQCQRPGSVAVVNATVDLSASGRSGSRQVRPPRNASCCAHDPPHRGRAPPARWEPRRVQGRGPPPKGRPIGDETYRSRSVVLGHRRPAVASDEASAWESASGWECTVLIVSIVVPGATSRQCRTSTRCSATMWTLPGSRRSSTGNTLPVVEFSIGTTSRSTPRREGVER